MFEIEESAEDREVRLAHIEASKLMTELYKVIYDHEYESPSRRVIELALGRLIYEVSRVISGDTLIVRTVVEAVLGAVATEARRVAGDRKPDEWTAHAQDMVDVGRALNPETFIKLPPGPHSEWDVVKARVLAHYARSEAHLRAAFEVLDETPRPATRFEKVGPRS